MREFQELWPGGPVFAQAAHFPLGTDSVLLADFANVRGVKKGIDLGCGSGVLSLLLLARTERLHMTGLELLAESAETARDNLQANALETRGEIVCGDIRAARSLFRSGAFDLVVANPPYYPLGTGALPEDPAQAAARGEVSCTRSGGRFCLVHKPERLADVFAAMRAHGFEPKRLRLVCADRKAAPSLILLESRRGGKPGLAIEPALFLRGEDGEESAELKRIYRKE